MTVPSDCDIIVVHTQTHLEDEVVMNNTIHHCFIFCTEETIQAWLDKLRENNMDGRFDDMLKFGINLKLSGPGEDRYYTQRLVHFIRNMEDFDADTEDDEEVNIYVRTELSLIIRVQESVLTFEPLEDSCYDGIMAVLDFIANMHQLVQDDYLKEGELEDEFSQPSPIEYSDEEESDDDMEWI